MTSLNLSGNRIGVSSAEGGESKGVGVLLARAIAHNSNLTALNLNGNAFSRTEVSKEVMVESMLLKHRLTFVKLRVGES